MWRAYDDYGTLAYTFAESVAAMHPYYVMRAIGGMLFTTGAAVMLFNMVMTIRMANARQTQLAHA
jgi:cytochrome c oxidase cbb3-type subunit 1